MERGQNSGTFIVVARSAWPGFLTIHNLWVWILGIVAVFSRC